MSDNRIFVKSEIDESPSACARRGLPRLLTTQDCDCNCDCDCDQSRRAGFTFCELLFIIGIIAILVSILVPAVQGAREAARRVRCRHSLSQLGITIQNYSIVHGSFPIGVINQTGPIRHAEQGYHFSWLARILPQLDRRVVFENLNFNVSVYDELNRVARSQSFPIFRCSSDHWNGSNQFPGSNYVGCHHHVKASIDDDNHGAFVLNRTLTFVDFPDGLSNTIMIGEKVMEQDDLGWASGTRSSLRNMGWKVNQRILANRHKIKIPLQRGPLAVGGFSSFHPGGALFGFGDGRVSFLSENTTIPVLKMLSDRADGHEQEQAF